MRASAEPGIRQTVLIAAFDRVDALRGCLDAMRAAGIPAEGLTLLAHEQRAASKPGSTIDPGATLAHEALIGGVLSDYLAAWGGLALVSIPGLGPTVVAGGARAVVAERLSEALAGTRPDDRARAALLAALGSGSWLLVAHGDEQLLAAADCCLHRHEAVRVERLMT